MKTSLKVEQVAEIDVLPESERMMSDRMRQGRERLLWADDAMVAVRLPKVELPPILNTKYSIPNTYTKTETNTKAMLWWR